MRQYEKQKDALRSGLSCTFGLIAPLRLSLKTLWVTHLKVELKAELLTWIAFMNGESINRPTEIATGKYKPDDFMSGPIPSKKQLSLVLPINKASLFYEMLDPDSKYRKRRNSIAHSSEAPSERIYEEFKALALSAFSEIEELVNESI